MSKTSLLIVTNDEKSLANLVSFFNDKNFDITTSNGIYPAIDLIDTHNFDVILSAYFISSGSGLQLLEYSRSKISPALFYFYDDFSDDVVIDSLRSGALDFFPKSKAIDEIYSEIINDLNIKNKI